MSDIPVFGSKHKDGIWGCTFVEVNSNESPKICVCHVDVNDLKKIAEELSRSVLNTSWIMEMDIGAQRSYLRTVSDTANSLVELFKATDENNSVSGEFGELMVSMGSSRSLEIIFQHVALPISELWKPQRKQNEGFDFHTVCQKQVINFGEAKYKSLPAASPVSDAVDQANGFLAEDKHFRDRVHLVNLVDEDAISNLDNEICGLVAAFSMNAKNPLIVYKNAIEKVKTLSFFDQLEHVYIVGVSYGDE